MTKQILSCFIAYIQFLGPIVIMLLCIHHFLNLPKEVFRKLLHIPAFLSAPVISMYAPDWQTASACLSLFAFIVWPILFLLERFPWYSNLFVERRPHEIRRSLLLLFLSDAILVAIGWGIFHQPQLTSIAIIMWGCGDAAAALIGKRYGKHHITLPLADSKKTWEGSIAMFLVSMVVGTFGMTYLGIYSFPVSFIYAAITAIAGAYVELITHGGYDTVTVPAVTLFILLLFRL